MQAWNNYWQSAPNSDCFSVSGHNKISRYFKQYWKSFFTPYTSKTKMLDLACGNGFIGHIMLENAWSCDGLGIDQADIQGVRIFESAHTNSTYRIQNNTSIESLTIGANSMDLVVSQFGAEYSQIDVVLDSILKAMKPSAKLHFVMHNTASELTGHSKLEVKILSYLLEKAEIQVLLASIINQLASGQVKQTNDLSHEMSELDTILKTAYQYSQDNLDLVNSYFIGVFALIEKYSANIGYKQQVQEDLDDFSNNLKSHYGILTQQVSVAKDKEQMSMLAEFMQALGFVNIQFKPLMEESAVLAWQLVAEK